MLPLPDMAAPLPAESMNSWIGKVRSPTRTVDEISLYRYTRSSVRYVAETHDVEVVLWALGGVSAT
jgi:hypothetical protein